MSNRVLRRRLVWLFWWFSLSALGCGETSGTGDPSPTCADTEQNGQETGIDCGGPDCPGCAAGQGCAQNGDCLGGFCHPNNSICVTPTCTDGFLNGAETDDDCGGATCPSCADGDDCLVGSDCESGVCESATSTCAVANCTDEVPNGDETDEDCGGPDCPDCADGERCLVADDCESGVCDGTSLTCIPATCDDAEQNGLETDLNCGGGECPRCADGLDCTQGTDCLSGICDPVDSTCSVPTCEDDVQNGNETDEDCGGPDCDDCLDGEGCAEGSDCVSGVCDDVSETCAVPTCEDEVENQDETDVDCGGENCGGCDAGESCDDDDDCASEVCQSGTCVHLASCLEILAYGPNSADGEYTIDIDGLDGATEPFPVYCDMTTDGGGWTMVLNLNTSDGHVMWWGNELWTNSDTYGDASDPWTSDHKGEAWNQFAGATGVLLVVHEDGSYRGWKHFDKANGDTMYAHFQGGDNTPLADAVVAADIRNVWTGEWLVNRSTALYANHCIPHDGSCTSGSAGSPDGDRIASHESAPTNNRGGGLGNWHDMSYCCSGTLAGKTCNGGSIRTASEAQAGWCSSYYAPNNGHFGSDSYFPATCVMDDGDCGSAAWSEANGFDYDYALFLREDNCGDDTLNGNETDVDCGGVCGRCSSGETCVHGNDCLSGTCDAGSCTATYQPTCQAILFALSDARDGVYTIDPDGTEGSMEPFNVFCDMTTAGGGWTVVERSPLGNAIGRALYQDYPVDEDAPESRRHRLSRARVDAVESLSDELYLHCGGGDFLKTASSYLYGGEDGSHSCGDNDLIGYDEAQLKGNLLRGVTLCTWYMGATEGCTGAFHIDESAQLVYCGLDNFPWTGSAITTPSADAFAMDTETRDVTEPLADCHLPGAVRHVMLRGRCSVDGEVNNDETDTDCGGSCPGCAAGLSCTNDGDCASYNCDGGTCGAPAASCLDILTADAAAPDGLYIIDIDGDGAGAPREVYCDMTTDGGGWTRLVYEDFESTTTGWSLTNTTTTCGRYGNILGGYNQTANGSNGKTYDLAGLSHTEARVELDYIKIDSWDPTEFAYLQIDGVEQYRANLPDGAPICGASSPGWHERRVHLDYTVDHTATTIEVRPGMVANQAPNDESWGVDNVEVWVR